MARKKSTETKQTRGTRAEDVILGVPARLMAPRLVLISCVVMLVGYGLVMIYSASSVTAVADYGDAAYYLIRQAIFAAVGLVAAVVLALIDYNLWVKKLLPIVWIVTVMALAVVIVAGAGSDTYGASRWLSIGIFAFQPSEFAKITLVFTGANLMSAYFVEHTIDLRWFLGLGAVAVGIPLLLIVIQPDKGTTLIILGALLVMAVFAGINMRYILGLIGIGLALIAILIFKDAYSAGRFSAMLDPFQDLFGTGWQLAQGYYAFGTGGLFGVGFGMSREKYNYLPFAHNDFIFAIIGEELGLLGTVGLILLFFGIAWAGYRIARYAPDLTGRLVAAGCTSILWLQMLVNVCGVVGIIPFSGKPIPFVSYGGSSIISSLMLVGVIVSVSRHSKLPTTVHDEYRSNFRVTSSLDDESTAGEPTRRSERNSRSSRSLTLVNGGARQTSSRQTGTKGSSSGRRTTKYERIDLGPTPAERLRGRSKRDR